MATFGSNVVRRMSSGANRAPLHRLDEALASDGSDAVPEHSDSEIAVGPEATRREQQGVVGNSKARATRESGSIGRTMVCRVTSAVRMCDLSTSGP